MRVMPVARKASKILHPFGVNLFGYARGELGIGEDVRLAAAALKANGIPCCIVEIKLGRHVSQEDRSAEEWISERPLYGINLFCQTGIEMARFVSNEGMGVFEGRYTIGLWPWELPQWPVSCRHTYALVNEIWGISSYTAKAYGSFPGPVHPMGLPVEIAPPSFKTRGDFGLSEGAYLFHFSFDLHSKTARKNPLGLIRAFQKAFPKEKRDKVGLVIKVNHPESFSLAWKKIRLQAALDPRIHVIERRMRRPEVLALMNACDCYVSLHRAEGFGRGIAEALLLGKQVIATGWSGNLDYCQEPRVGLVRHKTIPLKRGEYFHGEGQQWAEPDLDHAAELMRDIRQRPRDTSIGQPDFSPSSVGARYAKRLREIWEDLPNSEITLKAQDYRP
jgi:glycosyltransferase involved in cell wall biosynthesis